MGTTTIFRIILSIFLSSSGQIFPFFFFLQRMQENISLINFQELKPNLSWLYPSKIELEFIKWRGEIPKGNYKEEVDVMQVTNIFFSLEGKIGILQFFFLCFLKNSWMIKVQGSSIIPPFTVSWCLKRKSLHSWYREPQQPSFSSYMPNTTLSIRAFTNAPAHIGQGSFVT